MSIELMIGLVIGNIIGMAFVDSVLKKQRPKRLEKTKEQRSEMDVWFEQLARPSQIKPSKYSVMREKAREAYREQRSQDTEGGVPCSVSFIAGFIEGQIQSENDLKEAIDLLREVKAHPEAAKLNEFLQRPKVYSLIEEMNQERASWRKK